MRPLAIDLPTLRTKSGTKSSQAGQQARKRTELDVARPLRA